MVMLLLTSSAYTGMLTAEYLPSGQLLLSLNRMDDEKLEQFLPYLEHTTVSEEMKIEILRDLWKFMERSADEAWNVCPPPARKKPDGNSN